MQILERAETVTLERELVLRRVDGALALELPRAEPFVLAFEAFTLARGELLALGELGDGALERDLACGGVGVFAFEPLALAGELVAARAALVAALRDPVEARSERGGARRELPRALSDLEHLGARARLLGLERGECFGLLERVRFTRALVHAELLDLDRDLRFFGAELARLAERALELEVAAHQAMVEVGEPLLGLLDLGLQRAHLVVGVERRACGFVRARLDSGGLRAFRVEHGLRVAELGALLVQVLTRAFIAFFGYFPRHRELEVLVRRVEQHEILELATVVEEALGLRHLTLERCAVAIDLRDDVGHAQKVLARELHLALRHLAALLVLGDAGGLVDEHAPVLRTRAHDLTDAPLLDDRVRLGADAGAEEELGHVAQAHLGLVDEVLARPVAEEAAGHADLRVVAELEREGGGVFGVRVVEGDGHLREPVRPARLRAVEDHVLHRLAAQVLRALLAEAPPNGVHDVRLAAAVRADDADDVVVEVDRGTVHERFETRDLELLDVHRCKIPRAGAWSLWL